MRLTKVSMRGFKSFANHTEIAFDNGITGIVGPNGCGKSNVVDAIKWVLGTLSPKSLRGDEMMDVIFKGVEGAGPAGFAEVSLTLDNSDRKMPIEFDEVTVARRLYRSGESQYLINKADCRLKDVRELFYGTGIGTDNYAIIEQGKIDHLVMSTPVERRLIFEEAAGVSKYRVKKRETESKLERVAQDLLRLGDVMQEVTREMRSIKQQASRAERCKQYQEELKSKKLLLARHDYRQAAASGKELIESLGKAEEAKGALESELQQLRERLSSSEESTQRLAREEQAAQSLFIRTDESIASMERMGAATAERIEEMSGQLGRCLAELETIDRQSADAENALHEIRRQWSEIEAVTASLNAELEELAAKLREGVEECRKLSEEIESKKRELVGVLQRESQYKNEGTQIRSVRTMLDSKKERHEGRLADLAKEIEENDRLTGDCANSLNSAQSALEELNNHNKREVEAEKRTKEELAALEAELAGLRDVVSKTSSRMELLQDMEANFEGLGSGVREVLNHKGEKFPGILGALADFIDVNPEHLKMIEGALGDDATALVASGVSAAIEAAQYVRAKNLGRVTIIPLGGYGTASCGGAACEYVRAPEHVRPIVNAILGQYQVVQSIDEAHVMIELLRPSRAMVTIDGDIVYPDGSVSCGLSNGGFSILSRKSELKRLSVSSRDLQENLEGKVRERDEKERIHKVTLEKLNVLRRHIYEKSIEEVDRRRELEQLKKRAQVLADEVELIKIERAEIDSEIVQGEKRVEALNKLLEELAGLQTSMDEEIKRLGETLARYETTRMELHHRETAVRVELAKSAEKKDSLERRIDSIESDLGTYRERREQIDATEAELSGKATNLFFENKVRTLELEEARVEKERLQQQCESLRKEREALTNALESDRQRKQNVEIELREVETSLQDLKVKESEQKMRLERLREKIEEECGVSIEGDSAEADASLVFERDAFVREIEELRTKIDGMGSVNMLAIDRLKELDERHAFLSAQEQDLVKSKEQLQEMIRKIDAESKAMFEATLNAVRENFNTIFRKVFGGGKAEMILDAVTEGETQEVGVEIMVKPPGKDQTKLSLLSGGEKSLTALSLIMAIFKSNPSPFCILDEADAALDERNVDKYTGLIGEFDNETQFIVITHNKRTMAIADVLCGVTMERPGISKIVSVNLKTDGGKKVEELVGAGA